MKKRNRKMRKALLMVCCALALVAISVGATLAYLTDTEAVTNVFTVGRVDISLAETPTETKDEQGNNTYHLLPGQSYIKDPTITIHKGSEATYVAAMIEVSGAEDSELVYNEGGLSLLGIKNIVTGGVFDNATFNGPTVENGVATWENDDIILTQTKSDDKFIFMVYYKNEVVKNANNDQTRTLFTTLNIPNTWDNAEIQKLDNLQIVVTAYAMQAAGFEGEGEGKGVMAAWQACQGQFTPYDHNVNSTNP